MKQFKYTLLFSMILAGCAAQDSHVLHKGHSLIFEGFTQDDMSQIERNITAFDGYKKYRPVKTSLRSAEYWYETDSNAAELNRNLRLMLKQMGIQGRVVYSGNTIMMQKIAKPKKRN